MSEKETFLTADARPELSGFKAEKENTENDPIRFFKNNGERAVRIAQPGKDNDIIVILPEKSKNPELEKMTQTWEDIQHIVMLDQETLIKLGEISKRYNERQPLIIEGPPAVSKTFLIWVFACITEQPYARVPFSGGSRESTFIGGMSPGYEVRFKRPLKEILASHAVSQAKELLEKKSKDKEMTMKEELLLSNVTYLEEQLKAGTDPKELLTEVDYVQTHLGIEILVEHTDVWQDTDFMRVVEGGGIGAMDEINTVKDSKVLDALNPFAESHTKRIPMPAMRPGGDVIKHPDFFMVSAINPPKVKGRMSLPDPFLSRHVVVNLGNVTEDYIKNIMRFMVFGEDPQVTIKGKDVEGRTNVETDYRFLENAPSIESIIRAVAVIHMDLITKAANQEIGQDVREGGKYIFDQRAIVAYLNSVVQIMSYEQFSEDGKGLEEKNLDELNWVYIFKEALRQTYLSGMTDVDGDGDRTKIEKIIDAHPVWTQLERSQGDIPDYVAGDVGGKKGKDGEFTPDF